MLARWPVSDEASMYKSGSLQGDGPLLAFSAVKTSLALSGDARQGSAARRRRASQTGARSRSTSCQPAFLTRSSSQRDTASEMLSALDTRSIQGLVFNVAIVAQ